MSTSASPRHRVGGAPGARRHPGGRYPRRRAGPDARRRAHDRGRRRARLLPPSHGHAARRRLSAQRPHELRRLARVPGAKRRHRARPARLRALGQGRQSRLLAARPMSISSRPSWRRLGDRRAWRWSATAGAGRSRWPSPSATPSASTPRDHQRAAAARGLRVAADRPPVAPPGLGELLMGRSTGGCSPARCASARDPAGLDATQRVAAVWDQFDQGTQRAFLRLHRSIDAAGLAAAGSGLARVTAPALVDRGEPRPLAGPRLRRRLRRAPPARGA